MNRQPPIRAVTFDFWNTLYLDVEDVSAERARRRAALVAEAIVAALPDMRSELEDLRERISDIVREATRLRDEALHGFTGAERILWLLGELGLSLPSDAIDSLAQGLAELGVALPPRPAEGASEVLARVTGAARAGIVSDTGLTTGKYLRSVIQADGLAAHFGALGFSDETGWAKPHAGAFGPVLERLGVAPEEAAHVGDLAETDVAGALDIGMRAIWITPRRPGADVAEADVDEALSGIALPDDPRLERVGALVEVPAALRRLGLG